MFLTFLRVSIPATAKPALKQKFNHFKRIFENEHFRPN